MFHITAKDQKSIYEKGFGPSPTEHTQYSLLLKKGLFFRRAASCSQLNEKKGKSSKPDGVFSELIISLGSLALDTFLKLINLTWKTRVPHQWRKVVVILLLKEGKPAVLIAIGPFPLQAFAIKLPRK
ncbi:hypothetical protein TNCT_642431 [Trichonephila clavata]|uniref:Uncharacterized protein n=1 Tax=Trichonephila clavata TaxID=2740835 RepID=A0A8X6I2T7_TRICU|nr:hypothetical protein TNCT_642431 [Trichonephila clavata]